MRDFTGSLFQAFHNVWNTSLFLPLATPPLTQLTTLYIRFKKAGLYLSKVLRSRSWVRRVPDLEPKPRI